MHRKILNFKQTLVCVFFFTALGIQGQETRFFMPKEIAQAYQNKTRSYDGRPGPAYWHNTVDYDIEVEVMPEEKKLEGTEAIVYHNNSPDVLDEIVIRLYHDVFREANARAFRVRPDDINQGVVINRISVGGKEIDVSDTDLVRRQGTNMTVQLPKTLASGGRLNMEIDWAQQIPETTVRTGYSQKRIDFNLL